MIFPDFNLSIKAGEKIAIVGKSGVGKSTLLDILTGIIKPNNGHLKINGIDIHLKENQGPRRAHLLHQRQRFLPPYYDKDRKGGGEDQHNILLLL